MSQDERRIPLLEKKDWTDKARDLFAVLEGPEARETGPKYDIVLQLAQNPELTIPFLEYNKHLMFHSSLDHRGARTGDALCRLDLQIRIRVAQPCA